MGKTSKEGVRVICDYSLQAVKSRAAVKEDQLVTRNFNTGTRGFSDVQDPTTAVCVLPGTELAFDAPIQIIGDASFTSFLFNSNKAVPHNTAVFRQINKDNKLCHHDCLEFPDGNQVLLTFLVEGQTCKILQLPAAPKTAEEAEEQKRAEYV